MSRNDDGYFSVSVASTLVVVSLVGVAIIALSQRTAALSSRRENAVVARYASEALAARTLREIEVSGHDIVLWANAQRREVWRGQSAFAKIVVEPWDRETRACLQSLSLQVNANDEAVVIAGVETSGGPRAEVAMVLRRGSDYARSERRLLGGASATCVLS